MKINSQTMVTWGLKKEPVCFMPKPSANLLPNGVYKILFQVAGLRFLSRK